MDNKLEATESRLFNHLWWNGMKGFIRSAVIGVVIGGLVGALIFGLGVIPASFIPPAVSTLTGGSAALSGAIIAGTLCILPAGRVGQVAAIQSTRDARRYLHIHEAGHEDALLPRQQDPLGEVEETIVHERMNTDNTSKSPRSDFTARVQQREADQPVLPHFL